MCFSNHDWENISISVPIEPSLSLLSFSGKYDKNKHIFKRTESVFTPHQSSAPLLHIQSKKRLEAHTKAMGELNLNSWSPLLTEERASRSARVTSRTYKKKTRAQRKLQEYQPQKASQADEPLAMPSVLAFEALCVGHVSAVPSLTSSLPLLL